jgi:hypothetical protein
VAEMRNSYKIVSTYKILKEEDDLRDLDIDGQVIKTYLKREQYGQMMCAGFISLVTDKFGTGSFVRV